MGIIFIEHSEKELGLKAWGADGRTARAHPNECLPYAHHFEVEHGEEDAEEAAGEADDGGGHDGGHVVAQLRLNFEEDRGCVTLEQTKVPCDRAQL